MAVIVHTSGESCQRVVRRLLREGATSVWSAKPYEPKRLLEQRAFERGIRIGLIVPTGAGTYYVDVTKYEAWCAVQRRILIVALTGVALLLGILYILGELA